MIEGFLGDGVFTDDDDWEWGLWSEDDGGSGIYEEDTFLIFSKAVSDPSTPTGTRFSRNQLLR